MAENRAAVEPRNKKYRLPELRCIPDVKSWPDNSGELTGK
jgi:hypothetical protein